MTLPEIKGKQTRRPIIKFRYFVIPGLVALMMYACERHPSESQVVGTYFGTLNGAEETIVLSADHTFTQKVTLPSGERISTMAKWKLVRSEVVFDHYTLYYDDRYNGALAHPFDIIGMDYTWGADLLIRDWGSGYYTLKHQ